MRLQSLIFDGVRHSPVEVELTLWPGLPGIQFLGLPDQHIKESAARIKSAIRSQGFKFPTAKQIYVNLRPNYLKKSSKGLELAVAAAYLMETGQIPTPPESQSLFYFGELDLSGAVYFPKEKIQFDSGKAIKIVSGPVDIANFNMQIAEVHQLAQLNTELNFQLQKNIRPNWQRPSIQQNLSFSPQLARLLHICSVGKHSLLIAGAAGAGKTTFAKALFQLLPDPSESEWLEILADDFTAQWRPFIQPHPTTPTMTLIGGGHKVTKGEIARAHNGLLLLDEFLEFAPHVIETLRGPLQDKKIRVVRAGQVVEFPADSLIVATTNLCPCGQWTPDNKESISCRFSGKRCRSKLEKLSGPILDRFEVLAFFNQTEGGGHTLEQIQTANSNSFEFRQKRLQTPATCSGQLEEMEKMLPDARGSLRRKQATLGVARTIADIEGSKQVRASHVQEALHWTFFPFQKISFGHPD